MHQARFPGRRRVHSLELEGWTVGNILIGGVIGLGVDAATGAINDYPDAFQVPMTPIPGATPVLSPQAQNTPPNS